MAALIRANMIDLSRRNFITSASVMLGAASLQAACSRASDPEGYEAVAERIHRGSPLVGRDGASLRQEIVRFATLAPSSHNTQCWKFAIENKSITISADTLRLCPAVDPDSHHVYVSLGCATENLVHASLAHGLKGEATFDVTLEAIRVALTPTRAETSPLYEAIPTRQCTRGDYDARPLSNEDLSLLERAGTSDRVRMLLITERLAIERVLDYVVHANTAQMADPAFVRELRSWIRFNGAEAVSKRDGLYSATTGNPNIPTWLGELAFGSLFSPKSENDKYARQVRSSAGIAVFVGHSADRAHWIEVGRCYERFALQATALGIRNAHLNQPVEVQAVRPQFATAFGLTGQRPDLVVRFGRGPTMPSSLHRQVQAVLVRHDRVRLRGQRMTWLLWLVLVLCLLTAAAIGISACGSKQWAASIRALSHRLEADRNDSKVQLAPPACFEARELQTLPAPVQRYFHAVLKDGQPIVSSVAIEMVGTFNISSTTDRWKPFVSRQRIVTCRPGFLWDARISMAPGLRASVVDSYIAGAGLLHAAILGLFTVAKVSGEGEVARAEFMRFLAEAAWYPTALLPSQGVKWEAVDDRSANASIADGPLALTLLFMFSDGGLIDSVRAEARGALVGDKIVMTPWECRLSDYQMRDGMNVPIKGEAAWIRPEGRRPYFRGSITSLSYEFAR